MNPINPPLARTVPCSSAQSSAPIQAADGGSASSQLSAVQNAPDGVPGGLSGHDPVITLSESPNWLTEAGDINYSSHSYIEIFEQLVMTEEVSPELLQDYAENFCEEYFDEDYIYDSSDPYYTLKELRREGLPNDDDWNDLMADAKEACCEKRLAFLESTLVPALVAEIECKRSERSNFDLDQAFQKLKDKYYAEHNAWALGVMHEVAVRRACPSSDSD